MPKLSLQKKNFFVLFTLLLTFALLLVGCGEKTSNSSSSQENDKAEESNTESKSSSREITHAMGTTTIEGTPTKIVTLYQGATDVAVAMGIKPVGVVESWAEAPVYNYMKNELDGVAIVGQETQPNLEEIAKLKPDLIIASKVRHEEIYDQLSQIAPTVAHETVFDFKGTAEMMGQAMNQEDKVKELLGDWDTRVADFQTKIKEKLGDKWPFHVSVVNFRADHARIYVTGYAGSILSELGFQGPKNLTDDSLEIVKLTDKESITQMNADVIYMFMENDETVKKTYEDWTNHPLWKELDAVKANQVYQVDEINWNLAGGITSANLMLDDIYDKFELEK
ncbi:MULTISPECIES: iron-siderophore ABC transporter substrate-binding protein [Lysinibacillus]|uniref:ABC transporter substrate-binding protein n=1 Tax=Lysinibacillus TaxID=400634 RepID=UPI001C8B9EF8|nr:iron-siderophore ABC transporter substrate-binding protein [Lysinibacillus sp. K60]MBX8943765.1 iron-siderophore ABC transporter substrate-binding protein [Lysinibacillus sp. K60]UNT54500.1 iron-siderophore ABC transporter substrate-binding protein [Lysinibacillus capsici]